MTALKYWDAATGTWKFISSVPGPPGPKGNDGTIGVDGAPGGKVFTQTIGDGVSTSFTINHALSTRNVTVSCYRTASPYEEVMVDVERTDIQTVTIKTAPTIPGSGEFTVVVAAAGATGVPLDSWHTVGAAGEPAFQNSWGNTSGYPAAFRKDSSGRVSIRGMVVGGTVGATVFTLPAGYRPPGALEFINIAAATSAVRTIVNADGTVVAYGSNSNHSLVNCEFDTDSVVAAVSSIATPLDSWHYVGGSGEPAFQNSWVNHSPGTYPVAAFRKSPDGKVQIRGLVKGGTANATIFTLPVGYRPPSPGPVWFASDNGGVYCRLRINADGTVSHDYPAAAGNAIALDVIEFDTDTNQGYASGVLGLPVTMDSWHNIGASGEPAFQNSWVNYASGFTDAGFRKLNDGKVRLRGLIKNGAASTTVFTLPLGYRPPRSMIFICQNSGSAADVRVDTAGQVVIQSIPGGNGWVSLDPIEFDTESVLHTASVAAQPQDAWHVVGAAGEPAFLNSWVNMGGVVATAAFRKYQNGKVKLRGGIKTGTIGQAIFTLPAGYRPAADQDYAVASAGAFGRVVVEASTGNVFAMTGSNATFYLNNVEFDTESVIAYTTGVIGPARVTSLPPNPIDGQECYYVADATNGILWHLRYNAASASAYKWEFVGGTPLYAEVATDETLGTTYNTYVALPTAGPSLVLPLAGDYMVGIGAGMQSSGGTLPNVMQMSYDIGATGAVDADSAYVAANPASNRHASFRERRKNGLTAVTLTAKYKQNNDQGRWMNRWMRAEPVRVG